MGAGTRAKEIRRRWARREKRKREKLRELRQALQRGRTHADRVRIAQELRDRSGAGGA